MNKSQIGLILLTFLIAFALSFLAYLPKKKYTNQDFGIATYQSTVDQDQDGIDDQTDILNNVRAYIKTKPSYKSKYYATGYPDDQYGVCTDVVAFGLKDAGYDLMNLVNQDVLEHPDDYGIDIVDRNIDFRRVHNLLVYFEHTAISLTTDINKIEEWQGGDIVVFEKHIGIVSDLRNRKGIPYVIHHARPYQMEYEEDILTKEKKITGHFRIS